MESDEFFMEFTPPEISAAVKITSLKPLPQKSKESYTIGPPCQVQNVLSNLNIPPLPVIQNGSSPYYLLLPPNINQSNNIRLQPMSANVAVKEPQLTYLPVMHQMPTIKYLILNKQQNIIKKKSTEVEGYKNPFNYKFIDKNINRGFVERMLKLEEKELTEKVTWKCMICATTYEEKDALIDHYEVHKKISDQLDDNINNESENIKCPVCEHSFNNEMSYNAHVQQKHRPKEFSCNKCDSNYNNAYYLSVHLARHSSNSNIYVCVECKQFCTTQTQELSAHILKEHVKNIYPCKECGKSFTSEIWFRDHKIFHLKHKKFFCDKCKMVFPSQRFFIAHMKNTHKITIDMDVKFKCFQCNLNFPMENNLLSHNRYIHPKPNTFLCNTCGKGFPLYAALSMHMKTHEEGQYVCSTCGKIFKKGQTLKLHLRTHTGEKPNKCNECGKCFTQKSTLNVHLRTHSGERPYPCGKCKKGFITKTIRDIHQKTCKK